MASPILDLLTGRARAALPFIQAAVEAGLNATETITSLKPLDLTFRRADMLAVIRAVGNQVTGRSYLASVRNDFLPNPLRFPVATTFTSGKYSYLVRIDGIDALTGAPTQRHITVATDTLLTKQEAAAAALDAIASNESAYAVQAEGATVTNAFINPLFAPGP